MVSLHVYYLCTVISLTTSIKVKGNRKQNLTFSLPSAAMNIVSKFLCLPVNNYMFQRIYNHNLHSFFLFVLDFLFVCFFFLTFVGGFSGNVMDGLLQ